MAFQVLGQLVPATHNLEVLYIVPADKQVIISTINICNQSAQDAYFYISIAPSGATDNPRQYIYYMEPVRAYRSFEVTRGLTLPENCHIRVKSSNGLCSFQAFGDVRDEDA